MDNRRTLLGECETNTLCIFGRQAQIRAIREMMEMSQEQFALEFGLELATVRNWEQGRSEPDTAARNFLVTIAHDPKAVRQALVSED